MPCAMQKQTKKFERCDVSAEGVEILSQGIVNMLPIRELTWARSQGKALTPFSSDNCSGLKVN